MWQHLSETIFIMLHLDECQGWLPYYCHQLYHILSGKFDNYDGVCLYILSYNHQLKVNENNIIFCQHILCYNLDLYICLYGIQRNSMYMCILLFNGASFTFQKHCYTYGISHITQHCQ